MPVMVMEPVHGGMLASLPEDCMELLPKGDGSPAAWALRFVMDLPGIAVVLSGMSDMEQVKENIATADSEQALTGAELSQLARISEKLRKKSQFPVPAAGIAAITVPRDWISPHCFPLIMTIGMKGQP